MLRELRIKDFTIIDDLSISFQPGLNVLSGETGAGKSIIIDALGVLLGDKASQDFIRAGSSEARIEATFDPSSSPLLSDIGVDGSECLILRRVTGKGRGRAYINDTPVSITSISTIGSELVDIHGQHEHQGLLRKEGHLALVDAFGRLSEETYSLQKMFGEVSALRSKVLEIKEKARERALRIDFLKFQINEIDAASLGECEKQAVEEERAILLNASRLREFAEAAYGILYESEGSAAEKLSKAAANVRDMARIDRNAEEGLSLLESALPLVEDASSAVRRLRDTYEVDPARLADLDDRLELIKKLEKKYGDGIEGILRHRVGAMTELQDLEQAEEQGDEFEKKLSSMESSLAALADELSRKRKTASGLMSKLVVQELRELGFQKADFRVDMKKRSEVGPTGMDELEFLFSANPGEPPKPLSKVASGGELSRIMLALKCLEIGKREVSGQKDKRGADHRTSAGTLIFDEVDAGIGGVTAQHVGNRLHLLAEKYQVLCITHLPQIAALADCHLRVEKVLSDEEVRVRVEYLEGEKRREELARMLGGKVTDRSLKHAEEMLGIDK